MLASFFRHLWSAYWQADRLLPATAQARLAAAIAQAEQGHAGEICVVIEASLSPLQLLQRVGARERALQVFATHRVWDTEHNSGVLVYLLLADHAVEIVTDRGLRPHDDPFWDETVKRLQQAFRSPDPVAGCAEAIARIGDYLRRRFPSAGPNPDELPNPVQLL